MENTYGFDYQMAIGWVVPLIASYLVARWNQLRAFLADKNKWIVRGVYVALVILGFVIVAQLQRLTQHLPVEWGSVFWNGLVGGVAGTLIYRLARKTDDTNNEAIE